VFTAVFVSGCTVEKLNTAPGPSETASAESAEVTVSPETAKLQQTMQAVLTKSASSESELVQERLRSQLVAAGIAPSTLEVSASRTPTGLAVDAIEIAARLGGDCVMGQIREGKADTVVLPVLASGKCFLGDFR
jgi:hypothetical protein